MYLLRSPVRTIQVRYPICFQLRIQECLFLNKKTVVPNLLFHNALWSTFAVILKYPNSMLEICFKTASALWSTICQIDYGWPMLMVLFERKLISLAIIEKVGTLSMFLVIAPWPYIEFPVVIEAPPFPLSHIVRPLSLIFIAYLCSCCYRHWWLSRVLSCDVDTITMPLRIDHIT